jgi:hypothetical protein
MDNDLRRALWAVQGALQLLGWHVARLSGGDGEVRAEVDAELDEVDGLIAIACEEPDEGSRGGHERVRDRAAKED